MTDWRTENIRAVKDLNTLIDDANKLKKITLIVRADARTIFVVKGDIDFLTLQFDEIKTGSTGGALMVAGCGDLKVLKSLPVTKQILQTIQKGRVHPIADVEEGKSLVVTLQFTDRFKT